MNSWNKWSARSAKAPEAWKSQARELVFLDTWIWSHMYIIYGYVYVYIYIHNYIHIYKYVYMWNTWYMWISNELEQCLKNPNWCRRRNQHGKLMIAGWEPPGRSEETGTRASRRGELVVGHSGIESLEIKILWTLHFQYSFSIQNVHGVQSQKTNITPGRRPSQKETSLLTPVFQVLYWFQGGYHCGGCHDFWPFEGGTGTGSGTAASCVRGSRQHGGGPCGCWFKIWNGF